MESIRIRRAELDDAREMAEVHIASWQAAYPGLLAPQFIAQQAHLADQTARKQANIRAGRAIFVAIIIGQIVGFISYGSARERPDPDSGEIYALYLAPAAWGSGAGQALMGAALNALARDGYQAADVCVLVENRRARRFYERVGFSLVETDLLLERLQVTQARYRRLLTDLD